MIKFATCNDFVQLRSLNQEYVLGPHMAWTLKQFDVLYVMGKIKSLNAKRLLEIGGGLELCFDRWLSGEYDYQMIDKPDHFYDPNIFRKSVAERKNTKFIEGLIGENDANVPADYFDLIFSVGSVLTSTPATMRNAAFKSMIRALRPGGRIIHFIHLHLTETLTLAHLIRNDAEAAGFAHLEPPNFDYKLWGDPVLLESMEMVYEGYITRGAADRWDRPRKIEYQYANLVIELVKPSA
jgi:SAM-dependent methyltransferase